MLVSVTRRDNEHVLPATGRHRQIRRGATAAGTASTGFVPDRDGGGPPDGETDHDPLLATLWVARAVIGDGVYHRRMAIDVGLIGVAFIRIPHRLDLG